MLVRGFTPSPCVTGIFGPSFHRRSAVMNHEVKTALFDRRPPRTRKGHLANPNTVNEHARMAGLSCMGSTYLQRSRKSQRILFIPRRSGVLADAIATNLQLNRPTSATPAPPFAGRNASSPAAQAHRCIATRVCMAACGHGGVLQPKHRNQQPYGPYLAASTASCLSGATRRALARGRGPTECQFGGKACTG
ncbi:hypothetical protein N658DRAFT_173704 [Parathielavia hyrcaniae]|uniref:Uncharacterized protein n=1 Tax=Parathielavia hyrcaniae TaxID=113614 RepID=A0AAN6Q143_9PEZI|nr:hypothetical protein N658DRAFT_173704 [Parathielavia hyrcaniae]